MTNNADQDQLASEEANWSGSTLFEKAEKCQLGEGDWIELSFCVRKYA